jgi:hypothetical protein
VDCTIVITTVHFALDIADASPDNSGIRQTMFFIENI